MKGFNLVNRKSDVQEEQEKFAKNKIMKNKVKTLNFWLEFIGRTNFVVLRERIQFGFFKNSIHFFETLIPSAGIFKDGFTSNAFSEQ